MRVTALQILMVAVILAVALQGCKGETAEQADEAEQAEQALLTSQLSPGELCSRFKGNDKQACEEVVLVVRSRYQGIVEEVEKQEETNAFVLSLVTEQGRRLVTASAAENFIVVKDAVTSEPISRSLWIAGNVSQSPAQRVSAPSTLQQVSSTLQPRQLSTTKEGQTFAVYSGVVRRISANNITLADGINTTVLPVSPANPYQVISGSGPHKGRVLEALKVNDPVLFLYLNITAENPYVFRVVINETVPHSVLS